MTDLIFEDVDIKELFKIIEDYNNNIIQEDIEKCNEKKIKSLQQRLFKCMGHFDKNYKRKNINKYFKNKHVIVKKNKLINKL